MEKNLDFKITGTQIMNFTAIGSTIIFFKSSDHTLIALTLTTFTH